MDTSSRGLIRVALICLTLAVIQLASGCAASPPQIGRNLGGPWAVASETFDARLKQRFPIGSSAGMLLIELEHQGFAISQDGTDTVAPTFSALYDAPGFPCRLFWRVHWSAENAKITAITGDYSGVCV